MSSARASRFVGVAGRRDTRRGRPSATDGLQFSHVDEALSLHTERPILAAADLVISVMGSISEVDDPQFDAARYRDQPERLVAELYAAHGKELARCVDGWFLIILHDRRRRELLLINNPYTNAGCYYLHAGDRLIFASDLKRILGRLDSPPPVDWRSLATFLNHGYNHTEHTCFQGVSKLPPGYRLLFRDGAVSLERYYDITFDRQPTVSLASSLDRYEQLFRSSLEAFLAAGDVQQVGAAISGGLDTSWTLYAATLAHGKPVHGYTVCFGKKQFDELDHAALAVNLNRSIHHPVHFGAADLDLYPELINLTEEPVLSVALPIYKMIKVARTTVDAMVVGEGGNNIYSLYYPVAEAHAYIRRLPWVLRRLLAGPLRALARLTGSELFWQAAHVARIYAAQRDYFADYFEHLASHYHFDRQARSELLDPGGFGDTRMHRPLDEVPLRDETFFDDLIKLNLTHGLKPYLLFFEHKMAAEHDMALAAPFVSKKVVQFACSLPLDFMVTGSSLGRLTKRKDCERWFHKLAMERAYPRGHVHREPQLFYSPYHSMLAARPQLTRALHAALARRGWYRTAYLDRLFAEHRAQREHPTTNSQFGNHGYRLMALLGCELWARLFLDGEGARGGASATMEALLE